jgi:hypothetical protein
MYLPMILTTSLYKPVKLATKITTQLGAALLSFAISFPARYV